MIDLISFYKDYVNTIAEKTVNIDFTHRCLLQCVFCMRQRQTGKDKIKISSDMSLSDFLKISKTFSRMHLCGQLSDPIYHPNFLNYVKKILAKDNIKRVTVCTNGSSKPRKFWKEAYKLNKNKLRWTFGIDGIDQKTCELHRIGQNFKSSFGAMLRAAKNNQMVCWQFIPFQHNEHQIPKAIKVAKKYGIDLMILKSNRLKTKEVIINNKKVNVDWIKPASKENITSHYGEPRRRIHVNNPKIYGNYGILTKS